MQKVVFVPSKFAPEYRQVFVKKPTGETEKTFFGNEREIFKTETEWEETGGVSDCRIDAKALAKDLEEVVSNLNKDGYEVLSVTPVSSGSYSFNYQAQGVKSSKRVFSETEAVTGGASFGYGYGFSYTEGLIVVADVTER